MLCMGVVKLHHASAKSRYEQATEQREEELFGRVLLYTGP